MSEELFDIIDDATGKVTGTAPRKKCHGNPSLIHRSVRVMVFHPDGGSMLLQKRAAAKDIFPGRWDCAVGGHLDSGETYEEAAVREMGEELGLPPNLPLKHLFDMKVRNEIESENVREFSTVSGGPFTIQRSELDEVRFFSFAELKRIRKEHQEEMTPLLTMELDELFKAGM